MSCWLVFHYEFSHIFNLFDPQRLEKNVWIQKMRPHITFLDTQQYVSFKYIICIKFIFLHVFPRINPMFSHDLKVIAQGGMPRTSSHFRGERGNGWISGCARFSRHQISLHWTNIVHPNWMHQPVVLCIQVCIYIYNIHIFGSREKSSPKNDTQFYRAINCWNPTKPSPQRCHFCVTFKDFRYAATLVRGWSLKKVWFNKNTIFFGSKPRILKLFSFSVYWNIIFIEEPVSISVVFTCILKGKGWVDSRGRVARAGRTRSAKYSQTTESAGGTYTPRAWL